MNPKRAGEQTSDAAPSQPPPPGERPTVPWGDPKVRAARSACAELLKGLDLDYEQLDPIKKGLCGTPAPIRVKSIGKDPAVVISPPAIMTCTLAAALHTWFEDTVQPSASALGTSVVKISNASSYKCRNRYGRADTKISEHALANALDISEFVFASGRRIKLLGNWPYNALQALPLKLDPPTPNPRRDPATSGVGPAEASSVSLGIGTSINTNPFVKSAAGAMQQSASREPTRSASSPAPSRVRLISSNPFISTSPRPNPAAGLTAVEARQQESYEGDQPKPTVIGEDEAGAFLKALHTEACKTFETVLGPDANAAHKDHFHLDMKKRRYVKICE